MNKRIISILLVFTMILCSGSAVFANAGSFENESVVTNYRVITDNHKERVAEEVKGNLKYVHSMDKINNVLTTKVYDLKNNTVTKEEVYDLNKLISEEKPSSATGIEARFFGHYQNTFSNYEYAQKGTSDSGNKFYELRRKDDYEYQWLSTNQNGISKYINAVDVLNAAEWVIVTSAGATAMWAIITYFAKGLTAGQVATATGVLAADVIAYNLAVDHCESTWRTHITYTE